jgi:beta-phosphoglucomutase-like phosphatase (HAD superfamily)
MARVAAASSSKNAQLFLERIRLDTFAAEQRLDYSFIHDGRTLAQLFDADISGRDFPRGKPDPMIFLTAAEELGLSPDVCLVVEDATSGVQAATAGGMTAIGVARLGDDASCGQRGSRGSAWVSNRDSGGTSVRERQRRRLRVLRHSCGLRHRVTTARDGSCSDCSSIRWRLAARL